METRECCGKSLGQRNDIEIYSLAVRIIIRIIIQNGARQWNCWRICNRGRQAGKQGSRQQAEATSISNIINPCIILRCSVHTTRRARINYDKEL